MLVKLTPDLIANWKIGTVKVVDSMNDIENGNTMSAENAMRLAEENGLDAVLIEKKNGLYPIVMIAEMQKIKYIQEKMEKKSKDQKVQQTKEVDFGIHIAEADYQQKLKKIKEFVDAGHRVNFIVTLRGREVYLNSGSNSSNKGDHIDEFINRLVTDLMQIGFIVKKPTRSGRNILGVITAFKKKN